MLNIGMVPFQNSSFPVCPLHSNGKHHGMLYDWGFTKVVEVAEHLGFGGVEEDMDMEDMPYSSDTDMAAIPPSMSPRSFVQTVGCKLPLPTLLVISKAWLRWSVSALERSHLHWRSWYAFWEFASLRLTSC